MGLLVEVIWPTHIAVLWGCAGAGGFDLEPIESLLKDRGDTAVAQRINQQRSSTSRLQTFLTEPISQPQNT